MCRRELLGKELRHGRLIAGRHVLRQTLPDALNDLTRQGRNLCRNRETRGGNAHRLTETTQELSDSARLTVRHHQRLTRKSVEALIAAHQRIRGVINVERVNQARTARKQRQATRGGTLQNTLDQLGIARTPHQVRAQRAGVHDPARGQGRAVRLQNQQLGGRLGTGVVAARMLRGRHAGAVTHDGRSRVRHRGRGDVQEGVHRVVHGGL